MSRRYFPKRLPNACVECKHHNLGFSSNDHMCHHPSALEKIVDRVKGREQLVSVPCGPLRSTGSEVCGPDGKLWEKKGR